MWLSGRLGHEVGAEGRAITPASLSHQRGRVSTAEWRGEECKGNEYVQQEALEQSGQKAGEIGETGESLTVSGLNTGSGGRLCFVYDLQFSGKKKNGDGMKDIKGKKFHPQRNFGMCSKVIIETHTGILTG